MNNSLRESYILQLSLFAWEQRKVFEIADRFDNLRVPVAANLRTPGNTPYYGANGIQDYVEGYTHDGEYILVAEDGASDLKNYPVNYVNGRIWVNNHAHVLQGKEKIANNKFLSYAMRLADIESVLVGGGRAKLNADIMMNLDIAIPSFNEQEQIGAYFSNLDNLITLHQRECGKPPFNQSPAWEQRKLGNCGTTYGGLTGKTKEDFGHGNARFIPYTNVFDNPLTDTKRLGAVEIDSSQNQVAYGDAFFTVSSETPDEVGMSSVWLSDQEDVYLNSFCFGYRQDSTFDPHYLAYMLRSRSVRSNLTLLAQGISRFNISKNKVMELSVPVPSAVEQEQLGQYFTKLDSLITLHQRMCPIFSFCAHGSRTNFAQTLQGWLQILRYPRPIPKMLVSPSAPASGVFGTAKGAFICASSSAGASTSSPSARKNFITSSTLCCRESLSSP